MVEVGRVHARELGKKAIFKELIRGGGELAIDLFKRIMYQELRNNLTSGMVLIP
ncbi:hypothetical protein TGAMA5MH_04695 [Trichoderma gamsii]|uniref:Uncharacterized protein n=1 Tax=Trichoderma gamsii TaxID=398673 RepID=A0A2K0TD73_9HYPO|nr:hypothetical protein TGAMA5MH_04695 [Trichoderma gamsii]